MSGAPYFSSQRRMGLMAEAASVGQSIPPKPLAFQGVLAPILEIPRSWGW